MTTTFAPPAPRTLPRFERRMTERRTGGLRRFLLGLMRSLAAVHV